MGSITRVSHRNSGLVVILLRPRADVFLPDGMRNPEVVGVLRVHRNAVNRLGTVGEELGSEFLWELHSLILPASRGSR